MTRNEIIIKKITVKGKIVVKIHSTEQRQRWFKYVRLKGASQYLWILNDAFWVIICYFYTHDSYPHPRTTIHDI